LQPQEWTIQTANDEAKVIYATLSIDGEADRRLAAVDDLVRRAGGTATWRINSTLGRSYALLALPEGGDAAAIGAASLGTVHEQAIIALALFPTVPEALLPVVDALGGVGRPAGVLCCFARAGAAIVEWDPAVTDARVIMELIDIELTRFHSGRVAQLLSPLPPSLVASVARAGLQAPEIEPTRILELQVEGRVHRDATSR
jgi:hypothetical protein